MDTHPLDPWDFVDALWALCHAKRAQIKLDEDPEPFKTNLDILLFLSTSDVRNNFFRPYIRVLHTECLIRPQFQAVLVVELITLHS